MKRAPIIICGVGPFARLMHFYFTRDSAYTPVAFAVDEEYRTEKMLCGCPVAPLETIAKDYPPAEMEMFIAIGYRGMRNRMKLFQRMRGLGYRMVNYVSSRAIVYDDLELGTNNVIMANVHIEPFVHIGDHNIFWSDTLVAHELTIGSGNFCAAKVLLGGQSTVGDSCFLGNGTIIINNLNIGSETHTLPGAVILQDTKPHGKYIGNPARLIDMHEETGIVVQRG